MPVPNNILLDGVPSGISNTNTNVGNGRLYVNAAGANTPSAFQFSQMVIFDQALTSPEMTTVTNTMRLYLLTGLMDPPTASIIVPTQSFTGRYFRFYVDGIYNTGWLIQIFELIAYYNNLPIPSTGVVVTSLYPYDVNSYPASNMFDGNPSSFYIAASNHPTETISFTFPSAITLNQYACLNNTNIKSWRFYGSSDNTNWFLLDQQTNSTKTFTSLTTAPLASPGL